MGIVVFNGISSKDVGVEVETFPSYAIPEKEYDVVHVPGRNGDLIIDSGTYKNVKRSYAVSVATHDKFTYSQVMNKVAEWLHSASGYARLEDSYDRDYYRMAYYNTAVSFENIFNQAGRGTIEFICKPQRFLKDGEIPVTFTSNGSIQNRTINPASPIIKVIKTQADSTGTLVIGDIAISIAEGSGSPIIIDCELQDAYSGDVNKNSVITLTSGVFPKLYPGSNAIQINSAISSIEITPRWWTI